MKVPAVIAIRDYNKNAGDVNFSRKNIFIRDNHKCQYCLDTFKTSELTLDHVLPRSKGGKTSWENIVSACKKCNHAKSNRIDIKPVKMPVRPNFYQMLGNKNFTLSIHHEVWLKYLNWPDEYVRMVA
jgi:5-methylcytosine-specific restriction endonuclease McrA